MNNEPISEVKVVDVPPEIFQRILDACEAAGEHVTLEGDAQSIKTVTAHRFTCENWTLS